MIFRMAAIVAISLLVVFFLFGEVNIGGIIGACIGCFYAVKRHENETE